MMLDELRGSQKASRLVAVWCSCCCVGLEIQSQRLREAARLAVTSEEEASERRAGQGRASDHAHECKVQL